MEPPSPNKSWASDSEEKDWWKDATLSHSPEVDMVATWKSAIGPYTEENALQGWPKQYQPPVTGPNSEEETCAKTNPPSDCSFLKKLWKIVCSHRFRSIWWGNDGNHIIISKKLFKKEVLGKRGSQKVFEGKSMRGFVQQLKDHGFSKMKGHSPLRLTIKELQAVVAGGCTLGKLLFYYSPFFKKYYPNLIGVCRHDTGEKNGRMAASPPGLKVKEERSRKRLDAQEAVIDPENTKTQTSADTSSTSPKPQSDTAAQIGSTSPPPQKQHRSPSPASMQGAPPMPFTASPQHLTPPTLTISFTLTIGKPNLPSGQQNTDAMQALEASLPPFRAPRGAIPMPAAASDTLMAVVLRGQAPTHHH